MDYSLDITGDTIVIGNFDKMQKKAGNLRPAFGKIADLMKKSQESNFRQQGARFGNRWARRKYAYAHPLMIKSGTLSKSFTSSYNSSSATISNKAKYGKYHQTGTRRLPVRNIIGWKDSGSDSDLSAIIRTLRQQIGVES